MGRKILTVDDSKTIRLIVARAFKDFDIDMFEAQNGVEGLALASRERPELIILDYTMPIMDGYEMLAKLKSDPELKSIPVIMLTAEASRENVLRISRLGVRDYLIKPFREDVVVERVGRVIELKPKVDALDKTRRYDDPLVVLVADDKPAIIEQIAAGLKDTPWKVDGAGSTAVAMERCGQGVPDAVLISLTLPENGAYTLYQMLRAGMKTKAVPVFGLCVKTAAEEQARAQQVGFTGIITKPIDFEDVKARITRALGLDTSYKYFTQRDSILVLNLPAAFTSAIAHEIMLHLRDQVTGAVDAGVDKLVIDMSAVKAADITLIKLGLSSLQVCAELAIKAAVIGSDVVKNECKKYEETKDWRFASSPAEALSLLGPVAVAA